MQTYEQMIAKHAQEKDVKKRAFSLVQDADDMLDEMAKAEAAKHGMDYLTAYGAVCKSELGAKVLQTREDAARVFEAQAPQTD